MTGSPPKNMRFKLMSEDPTASMMVRIAYPSADSRQVLLNGVRVPMNDWDDRIRNYGEIKFTTCGENGLCLSRLFGNKLRNNSR